MNISTVNELIQSLESAGELSIKELKYLELAKAYQQLAAENVTLDKMRAEHRADGVDMLYASKAGQWPSEYLAEIDEFSSLLREGADK